MMGKKPSEVTDNWMNSNSIGKVVGMVVIFIIIAHVGTKLMSPNGSSASYTTLAETPSGEKLIRAVTWNIAAINNNPFEYWITNEDQSYNEMMKSVSDFIENTGDKDIPVHEVFTDAMFADLETAMRKVGWSGVDETKRYWESSFKNRKIISEFIKDPLLGKKRLASMPDRITNTINTVTGEVTMRPTVINCFAGDLGSVEAWWGKWLKFYFEDKITVKTSKGEETTNIYSMIPLIKKSKYPSITEEEEAVSIPLETMCLAIFDSILVHMMKQVNDKWQDIRSEMCLKLNSQKNDRTVEILDTTYADSDIQFLQEVAGNFPSFVQSKPISSRFDIYQAASMDVDRDQNSYILLKKGKFSEVTEVTEAVVEEYNAAAVKKLPVVNGDLVVLIAVDALDGSKYLLASFHGDTNGLATIPVVTAVKNYATSKRPDCKMLFGLDANTYAHPEEDQQGVVKFAEFYTSERLNSCYGPNPNPLNFTTFHARTHLQPQLNKAVSLEEKDLKGDKNPKDFILFFNADFQVLSTSKDNTGDKKYIEGMVFPTLHFPSDHGVTSTVLKESVASKSKKFLK